MMIDECQISETVARTIVLSTVERNLKRFVCPQLLALCDLQIWNG